MIKTIELTRGITEFPKTVIIPKDSSSLSLVVKLTNIDLNVAAAFSWGNDETNTVPLLDSAGTAVTMAITANQKAGIQIKDLFAPYLHVVFSVTGATEAAISGETESNITDTDLDISATVDPNGSETVVKVQYGLTDEYELGEVTCNESPLANGTTGVSVSASLTELTAETEYHYRIQASNGVGITNGSDQTFTTTA